MRLPLPSRHIGAGPHPDDRSWKSDLLRIKPPLMPVRTTMLLVAPVWLAFIAFTALGQPISGLLVALCAYIVLFGGGQPVRSRLRSYLIAAIGLQVAVALGLLVGGHPLLTWLSYLAAAVATVLICRRVDPGPPGPYFFVLMVGGGTLLTGTGLSLPVILAHPVAGSLLAMIAGTIDALITQRADTGTEQPSASGAQEEGAAERHSAGAIAPSASPWPGCAWRSPSVSVSVHCVGMSTRSGVYWWWCWCCPTRGTAGH
ncbi:hypothetical protein [Brachybacterium epidermidis]|uniref:hypothetical protein n=1 Tax=Brachybacterium epidermidis TaxID=2781983 RepID=UPI00398E67B6